MEPAGTRTQDAQRLDLRDGAPEDGAIGRAARPDRPPRDVRAGGGRSDGVARSAAGAGERTFVGRLSGRTITLPDVDAAPMPAIADPGVVHDGRAAAGFDGLGTARAYPDVRSFRRKFGLLVPATNTSMEHELWSIVFGNQGPGGLQGVGLHTTRVVTPKPSLATADDLRAYGRQFIAGLHAAADTAQLAQPHYMIMGMSLEHILAGIDAIRAPMAELEAHSGLAWATWHDAIAAALGAFGARRIGLLTPFDRHGNASATRMFEDLGFDVATSFGFSCAHALHIAHVPDWAKERAILERLATREHRLDAVVQCGTNMSLTGVTERLEPLLGIPVLGINAVTFWYALRENGFDGPLAGAGRLLREF